MHHLLSFVMHEILKFWLVIGKNVPEEYRQHVINGWHAMPPNTLGQAPLHNLSCEINTARHFGSSVNYTVDRLASCRTDSRGRSRHLNMFGFSICWTSLLVFLATVLVSSP